MLYSIPLQTLSKIIIFAFITIACSCQIAVSPVYASSCPTESVSPRICPQNPNVTDYLLYIKKGGIDIISKNDYDPNFFLCEEYNYDCGYV